MTEEALSIKDPTLEETLEEPSVEPSFDLENYT